MPNSIEKPPPKHPLVEKDIFKSNLVKVRIFKEGLLVMFPVEDGKPNNRDACENNIVKLIEYIVVNSSTAKKTDPAEHPDRDNIQHVFVKHVRDEVGVSSISFTTVTKQQSLQHLELTD